MTQWARRLFTKAPPQPSYPPRPAASDRGESDVEGLFVIGDLAGTPLIKRCLNAGHAVVDVIAAQLPSKTTSLVQLERTNRQQDASNLPFDVVIIGAGPAGLGAAARAKELGLRAVVLEAEQTCSTVRRMFAGKHLFAEPNALDLQGQITFDECTREELLQSWTAQIESLALDVREHHRVTDVQKLAVKSDRNGLFDIVTSGEEKDAHFYARKVVLAIGKAGQPRKAGVPGEQAHATRVFHHLSDPACVVDEDVVIYGGGDVACEAALALSANNRVTLCTVDEALIYPKKRNADAILAQDSAGTLSLRLRTSLLAITPGGVQVRQQDGSDEEIPAQRVYEMIGAELPLPFLKRIGVQLEGAWTPKRYLTLLAVTLAVYSLYALKKYPELPYAWPFTSWISPQAFARVTGALFDVAFSPFAWLFSDAAYADMKRTLWFQTGYLYSGLYTTVMIVFGTAAMRRWARLSADKSAQKRRYQHYRYLSLIGFQTVFFVGVHVVAVQALSVQMSWRAWGLYQPWPLFFNTFNWWNKSDPKVLLYLFVGMGLLGTLVVIPVLSRFHGKRFCTWVCGCGGLAETLGDRWRHLAPKGPQSRAWEFQGLVVLAAAVIVTAITVGAYGTRADNAWAQTYSYLVDFWLVAVIPVALYPFFGGKVWCRYWCPLAAYNQVLAKLYGRLHIKANDKCISCTECSRHCQVGVDVMAFAKNGQSFDNRNSACIHCGVCIDVCPMDVLSFDTAKRGLSVVG